MNKEKKSRDFSSIMTETMTSGGKHGKFEQETRYDWGAPEEPEETGEDAVEKEKANFGLSGMLAADRRTGNVYNGVVLKFVEPADARLPDQNRYAARWRLYEFKGDELLEIRHISKQSAFLVGREKAVCDLYLRHPSLSKQHAVIQYRQREIPNAATGESEKKVLPYIMDLESTNGTFLNGDRIEHSRYYELREKDVLKFGQSSREYILLTDKADA